MPARNNHNLLILWKFFLRHNSLILPLLIQLAVLIKIGFTREFIDALIHALTSKDLEVALSFKHASSSQLKFEDKDNKDIINENTNIEEDDEYPRGDSCKVCKKPYKSTLNWCVVCDTNRFREDFSNWSSGNVELDKIIRNTQLNADGHTNYLEWIPYEKFTGIEKISEGGFGIVYVATWAEGPRWKWDDEKTQWVASGPRKVALKTLKCDSIIKRRKEFLKEVECHAICVGIKRIVHCFGVTRHPDTGNYMMVTNFANQGDLTSYIRKNYRELTWERVLRLSRDIAKALRELHRKGLVHCDLHSGNILNHVTSYGILWTWIADLGLCLKEDDDKSQMIKNGVFGKFEYIAPEVIRHRSYSKASDVYSFGIILWELTSCCAPFSDVTLDLSYKIKILEGKRPNIVDGTPPALSNLIQACWNEDPNLRPTMEEVHKKIWSFSNSIINGNRKDLYGFKAAERDRSLRLLTMTNHIYPKIMTNKINPKIIHSQLLPSYVGYVDNGCLSSKITTASPTPSIRIISYMDSCRIKDSTNNTKKESKATELSLDVYDKILSIARYGIFDCELPPINYEFLIYRTILHSRELRARIPKKFPVSQVIREIFPRKNFVNSLPVMQNWNC